MVGKKGLLLGNKELGLKDMGWKDIGVYGADRSYKPKGRKGQGP